jgi:hypothetical protein
VQADPAPNRSNNEVPIAAGGALALLAIGGAAVAMKRRRAEDDEEEWIEEDRFDDEPVATYEEPAVVEDQPSVEEPAPQPVRFEQQNGFLAPPVSAFSWGNNERAAAEPEPQVEQDDRRPGETWVERAYRGPSPLNPSVSLKTRLRRAAFFDKRERDAAAGLAEPVDPTAGLPARMVEEQLA